MFIVFVAIRVTVIIHAIWPCIRRNVIHYVIQQLAYIDICDMISAGKWLHGEHKGWYGETTAVDMATPHTQMVKRKTETFECSSFPLHYRLNCLWPFRLLCDKCEIFVEVLRNLSSEIRCGDSIRNFERLRKSTLSDALFMRIKYHFFLFKVNLQW